MVQRSPDDESGTDHLWYDSYNSRNGGSSSLLFQRGIPELKRGGLAPPAASERGL